MHYFTIFTPIKNIISQDMYRRAILLVGAITLLLTMTKCFTTRPVITGDPSGRTPSAIREFRAAWVATVANINWPSEPGIPVEQQKKEAIELLDLLAENNFNAVIFQVRPQCDALYQSDLEPWSYYLTGEQGKAPEPFYDPLEFWIEEAHKRGLELHAWLNPYRAHHVAGGPVTESSIVKRKPGLALYLERGYWWLDPSLEGTQDHSYNVVMYLVQRYDLDGIHFDDYFYPYPDYHNFKDFPDDESWRAYRKGGGKMCRSEWRRENVNDFIKRVYKGIKDEKPHVKFGLSPFGIWRPYNPPAVSGFDQHEVLYADARRWLNEGWIDYYAPQLYWPIEQMDQSYPVLLGWWSSENTKDRHLWPGINIGRFRGERAIVEAISQIMITRGIMPESPGVIHWSIAPLVFNPSLVSAISEGPYEQEALVPPSPWLSRKTPHPPTVNISLENDSLRLTWTHSNIDDITRWVVYSKYRHSWRYNIYGKGTNTAYIPAFDLNKELLHSDDTLHVYNVKELLPPLQAIAVSAVNRYGNESNVIEKPVTGISYDDAPRLRELFAAYPLKQRPEAYEAPVVNPGIDMLIENHLDLVRNKRAGLITNPSAVGSDLRSTIDILTGTPGVNLVALFGAEHGVQAVREGKITGEGEADPVSGIPVYSLYSDSLAPAREALENLDVLIFDIQGVGSAWYTYKYTMSYAMQACAEAGITFIVLDRPNPLGGRVVEGPMLDMGGTFRHPLPLRHGMTYGELATMWNETEGYGADLKVIKMKDWRRHMMWDDTGLLWVMPSPNMGNFETAVVYPGQCLFERSNISEGRGTTKPFLMTGSTWINAEEAADDLNKRGLPGVVFRPAYFIPFNYKDTGNPRGKPWNRMCKGVELMVTDHRSYRAVETSLNIIDAYRKTNPDSLAWSPPPLLKMIDEPGIIIEQVLEACREDIEEFMEIRRKYLLYK
ncbi:MAG: exo-beta-N-acetylmuramidase NamZ domain-containing protein [Bacteroidota bacterium]